MNGYTQYSWVQDVSVLSGKGNFRRKKLFRGEDVLTSFRSRKGFIRSPMVSIECKSWLYHGETRRTKDTWW